MRAHAVFHDSLIKYLSHDLEMIKKAMRIIFPWLSYKDALSAAGLQSLDDRRQELTQPLQTTRSPYILMHTTSNIVFRIQGRRYGGASGARHPPYKNALSANKLSVGKMLSVGRFLLVFVQSTDAITKSKTIYHI